MIGDCPKLKISIEECRNTAVCRQCPTGGSGVEPVIAVYCLKISLGFGPRKKNPSNIPDSKIQCVVTSGISLVWPLGFVAKKFATVEKKFYEKKKKNRIHSNSVKISLSVSFVSRNCRKRKKDFWRVMLDEEWKVKLDRRIKQRNDWCQTSSSSSFRQTRCITDLKLSSRIRITSKSYVQTETKRIWTKKRKN